MTRLRWMSLFGMLMVAGVLAFFLRDVIYRMLIVPLAHLFWLAWFYYSAIPQLLLWIIFLLILLVTSMSIFAPELSSSRHAEKKRRAVRGQIETLAAWMVKARRGTYFKWQIANRLGRIARELGEMSGRRANPGSENERVEKYLDAGLNSSFVDYPSSRNRFRRPAPIPLDLDPEEAVDHLESQMELNHGRHP